LPLRPQPRGLLTIATKIATMKIANNYKQDHEYQDHDHEGQCSYKHKRCNMRITKIKIMTTWRVTNNYNENKGK
jgi:hypothetical protein